MCRKKLVDNVRLYLESLSEDYKDPKSLSVYPNTKYERIVDHLIIRKYHKDYEDEYEIGICIKSFIVFRKIEGGENGYLITIYNILEKNFEELCKEHKLYI